MRTVNILKQNLTSMLQSIHLIRLNAVFWAVESLLRGKKLSLTSLGRSGAAKSYTKHAIKRADRLLGNKHLHKETKTFYKAIAHLLIKNGTKPVILVDWTRIEPVHIALVASIVMDGRAIPVYIEVHSQKKDSNPKVMRQFLKELKKIIPAACEPIIVTDAGFRNNWFKAVQTLNWDYVGRMRNTPDVCRDGETNWRKLKKLYQFARTTPTNLGMWTVTRSNPITTRIVACRKQKHGSKSAPGIGSAKLKIRRKLIEPWLLATSLNELSAKRIVKIYSKRMQIEETFRDVKNHRFGWSFRHARTNSSNRYEILLLISTLAMITVTLVGHAAEMQNIHHKYQANTVRNRRVLSLFFLGNALIFNKNENLIRQNNILNSIEQLRKITEEIDE